MNSPVHNSTPTKALRGIKPPRSIVAIGPDRRHSMITEAAYYFSEHRGFASGHELDDWLAAENQVDAAVGPGETPTLADPSSILTSADDVVQAQTMTEERKHEQKPWYPTIERMPLLYNVETRPNLRDDNPVLLLDAEAAENVSAAGERADQNLR
jgi:hypothetical protein